MPAAVTDKILKLSFLDQIAVSGSSQRKIARALGISAGSVNQMLNEAVLAGAVQRWGDTPRRTHYELSPTGQSERRRLAVELLVRDSPPYRIVREDLARRVRELCDGGVATVGLIGDGPLLELTLLAMLGAVDVAGIAPQASHGYPRLELDAIDPSRLGALVSVTNEVGADVRRRARAAGVPLLFFS